MQSIYIKNILLTFTIKFISMKKNLLLCAFAGMAAIAAYADVKSEEIPSFYATGISDNGQWIAGQSDEGGVIIVKDVVNNKAYVTGTLSLNGVGYVAAPGKMIANDGTAVAMYNGLPFYWKPSGTRGVWTQLPGKAVDGSASLGSITPDGSMIVGAMGETGLSLEGHQMNYPCVWYRNDDGTYGEPVGLPFPKKDPFGMNPQYMQCVSVSDDGKTIGAIMTVGSGFYDLPFIYRQDENGEWSYTDVGTALLNPENREVVNFPNDLNMSQPDPWQYLNDQQAAAFWAAFPEWARQEPQASMDGPEQTIAQAYFMAEFMNPKDAEKFLADLNRYKEAFDKYNENLKKYYEFSDYIRTEGINFLMNNSRISSDGKYAYFTGMKTIMINPSLGELGYYQAHTPVRFDVETGESQVYGWDSNLILISVSEDYSILCRIVGDDDYWPTEGWIFPEGDLKGMTIPEWVYQNGTPEAYNWMEENMYKEIITGVTETGAFQYDDYFAVGLPFCTPDMSLILCGNSTMYWNDNYADMYNFVSYLVNTGVGNTDDPNNPDNPDSSVDGIAGETGISIAVLPGSSLSVKGNVASLTIYDLSGKTVYSVSNPDEALSTGLPKGVYLIKAVSAAGETETLKAVF